MNKRLRVSCARPMGCAWLRELRTRYADFGGSGLSPLSDDCTRGGWMDCSFVPQPINTCKVHVTTCIRSTSTWHGRDARRHTNASATRRDSLHARTPAHSAGASDGRVPIGTETSGVCGRATQVEPVRVPARGQREGRAVLPGPKSVAYIVLVAPQVRSCPCPTVGAQQLQFYTQRGHVSTLAFRTV